MKKTIAILLIIVFSLAFLFGCANNKPIDNKLVVYVYDSFTEELKNNINNYMEKTYSIDVEFITFENTQNMLTQSILEKKNPIADVVIGLDSNSIIELKDEELFIKYKPKNFNPFDESIIIDKDFYVTPFDYGYICLNYNSKELQDIPQTWNDLLNKKYKNQIILINPATSSTGKAFLLSTIAKFGEEGYLEYWKKLNDNILTITSGWTEAYGLYSNGDAPIVLSYGTSPVYHLMYDKEDFYKTLMFENSAYAQIEVAGIMKNSKRIPNAQKLLDYIVSVEFQKLIPLNQFMYPVNPEVELPKEFSVAAKGDSILNIDVEKVNKNFEKWLSDWEKIILQN